MKRFYQAYVNGQGIGISRYVVFPLGSRIVPSKDQGKIVPSGRSEEIKFEASDRIRFVTRELLTVHSLLLHGSQASNEVLPFSDVDVVAVLDDSRNHPRNAINRDVLALRGFCRRMFREDPLMHHGLMFMNLSEFDSYDESFLPVDTLAGARSIYGAREVKITRCDTAAAHAAEKLRRSLYWLARYDFHSRRFQQDYSLKEFISGLLLLPAVFLASNGEFVKKHDSFNLAYTKFPNVDWSPVRIAEGLRTRWKAPVLHPAHRLAIRVLSGKAQSLGCYFYTQNFRNLRNEIESLQRAVQPMTASMERPH